MFGDWSLIRLIRSIRNSTFAMIILDINHKDSLKTSADILASGGVIVFPTDTVYGIGCLMQEKAIKKLYKIKNRPLNQPTAILLSEEKFSNLRIRAKRGNYLQIDKVLKIYPKGQVTVISSINNYDIKFPDILVKDNNIGVRIPNNKWLQELIDKVGPIVASSANKKGERTPEKYLDLSSEILEEADLIIKTSKKMSGKPSTIYDIENNRILR